MFFNPAGCVCSTILSTLATHSDVEVLFDVHAHDLTFCCAGGINSSHKWAMICLHGHAQFVQSLDLATEDSVCSCGLVLMLRTLGCSLINLTFIVQLVFGVWHALHGSGA